jgi:hypothetical protein
MALEYTIKAIQDAFATDDIAIQDEARKMISNPEVRRMILSNHGIDPTELSDEEVFTLLDEHSKDEV